MDYRKLEKSLRTHTGSGLGQMAPGTAWGEAGRRNPRTHTAQKVKSPGEML